MDNLRDRVHAVTATVNSAAKRWADRDLVQTQRDLAEFTMIRPDRFLDNLRVARDAADLPGAIVECGVWRGGMSAGLARVLGPDRRYVLFDSFEGLPPVTDEDGEAAAAWQAQEPGTPEYFDNCRAEQDWAQRAMGIAGIADPEIIPGWFDATVPVWAERAEPIAVLRLDGDWFESTMVCLQHLFPLLVTGGRMLLDDYGTWEGCNRAVHQYLADQGRPEAVRSTPSGVAFIIKE